MKEILSVENMKKSDARLIEMGVPSKFLMQTAGEAICSNAALKHPVAIVCGSGNNAGDGYAAAAYLKDIGEDPTVFILSDKFSEDGKFFYDKCKEKNVKIEYLDEKTDLSVFNTVIDCLLGTGFHGEPDKDISLAIDKINSSGAFVVSADINSGLSGNSGMTKKCVISDITVSIGSFKPGHFLNMAKDVMRSKVNAGIGIKPVYKPYNLIEEDDIRPYLPKRKHYSNKSDYGYIALIGGSDKYEGAVKLAAMANAAMLSGAGVAMICAPDSLRETLSENVLETTFYPLKSKKGCICMDKKGLDNIISRTRTTAFGMGAGRTPGVKKTLKYLIDNYKGTLIIDADGLYALKSLGFDKIRSSKCKTVLTPHVGEFCSTFEIDIDSFMRDPISCCVYGSILTGSVILLKGPSTIITDGQEVLICDRGCPGMATAGSGDVLSGVLAATASYIDDPLYAAATASYIAGLSGELAQEKTGDYSMRARDTISMIADAISRIY